MGNKVFLGQGKKETQQHKISFTKNILRNTTSRRKKKKTAS
jgi:hypothetical protein